jgi:NitT/TauT family transport system ATP-binding protein
MTNGHEHALVTLDGVHKVYGRNQQRFVAVQDVDLVIFPAEFVCLIGPSGCGKSTLLRIIAGLDRASEGDVFYRGRRLQGVNPHATIVFQTFALFPWLTVLENVELALKARGISQSKRRERALNLIDTVGLDGFESAYPRELSGGMRQKVGFARAMAVEPELLCLDEPFSALDVLSAEALRGELMELWLNQSLPIRAILMVTHNIEEAVLLADRIIVMDKDPGRIVAELAVALPQPRNRKNPTFQAVVDRVYATVAGRTDPEAEMLGTAPGQLGATRRLPSARINALAGLTELLAGADRRADLPRLADDLRLELDDLLPLVEAAELLGFAEVAEGDIFLTALGQAFAEASILARKEIIAGRILRQPTVRWIYETLQRAGAHRIAEGDFLQQLRPEFGDLADEQLDIAIHWGRYAEIFGFDDDTDELYVES